MTRWRPAARSGRGLVGEQDAVGRQREVADARLAREQAHEVRKVAAHERLTAGQPELVHAEVGEDIDEDAHLLEIEDVLARQPRVVALRHAVLAAQVAAVGDRQA